MIAATGRYAPIFVDHPDGFTVRPLTFVDNLTHTGALIEAMRGQDVSFDALENNPIAHLSARWIGLPLYYQWACTSYGMFEDGRLAGAIHLHGWRQALHISALAVEPAYRRRGIGRSLLRLAERVARHLGRRWLSLRVTTSNEPAVKLYLSEGFKPAHHRTLSLESQALRRMTNEHVKLRPLGMAGPGPRAVYRRCAHDDLAAGETWAADIIAAQAATRSLTRGRRRWLCRVNRQDTGYLALSGPGKTPRLFLASQPQWWGTPEEAAMLAAALLWLPQTPERVTVRLASQGHHEASLNGLAGLAPEDQSVPKMSMLKLLDQRTDTQGLDGHNGR